MSTEPKAYVSFGGEWVSAQECPELAIQEAEFLYEAVERFIAVADYQGSPLSASLLMQARTLLKHLVETEARS